LVELDIELKDEFKDVPLRSKCWPMAKSDVEEIEKQVGELIENGLVREIPHGEYPKYCSSTFLVVKKESKSRRMVGNYVQLNRRTRPHCSYLPNMEVLIEDLCKCKFKTKMDLRSGFWQVGMSKRAQELTTFTTPSGRCFQWLCMPFGLQGAPGVFAELMEILCGKVKRLPHMKSILDSGFLGAFFDDVGLGSDTRENHLLLLEAFLKTCMEENVRIKLSKCEFMVQSMEYLGYNIGYGQWAPSLKRGEAISKMKVRTLSDLRSILGAANFYRRHIPNFTQTTARLTDKLRKNVVWSWDEEDERHLLELKKKMASPRTLGVPRRTGEIILVSDASDVGGGSILFQMQDINDEQIPPSCQVEGLNLDGSIRHTYPSTCRLVPLGHWNWKWNDSRVKYDTYQRELPAVILIIGSQYRIIHGLPIIWFCDNQATCTFLDSPPPLSARLRRWFAFLSQFRLKFIHLPGQKNEFADYLSRNVLEAKFVIDLDELTKEAFVRMDTELDFSMQERLFLITPDDLTKDFNYHATEFKDVWEKLQTYQAEIIEEKLFYKNDKFLFCERLLVVPENFLQRVLTWSHKQNGHSGSEKTLLFFLRHFFSWKCKTDLLKLLRKITESCEVCLRSKSNTFSDRGLVSALSIPQVSNELLFIDFISMDPYNGLDYVLTIVDALTRFVRFIPCTKNVTGEATLKIIMSEWISHYGAPKEILSDNDVRFSSEKGFYQRAFASLGISTRFSIPRHPESNGLCERINRSFIQNIRILSLDKRTIEWPKLVPFVTHIMNAQVSPQTGFSPHELFLGKESYKFQLDGPMDPGVTPTVKEWLEENLRLQEMASKRLLISGPWQTKGQTVSEFEVLLRRVSLSLFTKVDGPKGSCSKLNHPGWVLSKLLKCTTLH